MKRIYTFIAFLIIIFVAPLTTLKGQMSPFSFPSDSLLFHDEIKKAMKALEKEAKLIDGAHYKIKREYLTEILQYKTTFDETLFPKVKSKVDELIVSEYVDEKSKLTYLNHFIYSFSKRILIHSERINYSNKGLEVAYKNNSIDTFFTVQFLFHRGDANSEESLLEEAKEDLLKAEGLNAGYQNRDKNMSPKIKYLLGYIYKSFNGENLNIGYEYFQKAEQEFLNLDHPDTLYLGAVYGMLSDFSWNIRDYEKGLNYVRKYKNLLEQVKYHKLVDPVQAEETRYHLFYKEIQFYHENQKSEALKVVRAAEKNFGNFLNNPEIRLRMAAIYNFMGELYIRTEPGKSVPYYKKAIDALDNGSSTYHLQYLFNLGKASLYEGNPEKAIYYTSELIEKAESVGDSRLPFFYFLKAFSYIKLNELEKALEITDKVILYMDPSADINLIAHTGIRQFQPEFVQIGNINLLSRMGLEFMNGFPDNQDAQSVANAIFQLGILEYGRSIKSEKVTFYTKSMYEQLTLGLLLTKDFLKKDDLTISELIEFSENTNEKYFWTNHKLNNDPTLFFDEQLLEEENKWRNKLIDIKQKALTDSTMTIRDSIFDIELELEKIEAKKKGANTSYYNFEEAEFEFDKLEGELNENTLILKYEFIQDSLFLFTISPGQTTVQIIHASLNIKNIIEDTYQMISDPQSPVEQLNLNLEKLGNLLVPDMSEKVKAIVFQCDDYLNLLPFDLLRKNNRYLIEDFAISYVTALGLLQKNKSTFGIKKALIISPSYESAIIPEGDLVVRGAAFDLAGAMEEANMLGEILPGTLLLEEKALKSTFKMEAGKYDLLHFSMHSLLNDMDPELSNLAFYDGETDNKLFINELYGMKLNAHMAVLSACNTGIGKEELGEGIVSLNRAFTFAGVPSVVSSLWSAPDKATSAIMVDFYKNLKKGLAKAEALRAAKLEYIQKQELEVFKHPFYWAGFVVHGDPSPLKIEKGFNFVPFLFYLAIGLVFLGLGYFLIRKLTVFQKA